MDGWTIWIHLKQCVTLDPSFNYGKVTFIKRIQKVNPHLRSCVRQRNSAISGDLAEIIRCLWEGHSVAMFLRCMMLLTLEEVETGGCVKTYRDQFLGGWKSIYIHYDSYYYIAILFWMVYSRFSPHQHASQQSKMRYHLDSIRSSMSWSVWWLLYVSSMLPPAAFQAFHNRCCLSICGVVRIFSLPGGCFAHVFPWFFVTVSCGQKENAWKTAPPAAVCPYKPLPADGVADCCDGGEPLRKGDTVSEINR